MEKSNNRLKTLLAITNILSLKEKPYMKVYAIHYLINELCKKDNEFLQMCNNLES